MGERLASADMLVSPSRFYSRYMEERLELPEGKIEVMPNGIKMDGYQAAASTPEYPTIGYLARMCREKGLEVMVDGFIRLRKQIGREGVKLRIAGAMTAGDLPLINELKGRIQEEGLEEDVEWLPNLSREEKITFLQSLTLFSVPVTYPEAFGLYVLEAIACGVPVVQPDMASFPEIIQTTGGGVCVEHNNPKEFAEAWDALLSDPERLKTMREQGRQNIETHYSAPQMSKHFLKLTKAYHPTD